MNMRFIVVLLVCSAVRLQGAAYALEHLPKELGFVLTDSLHLEVSGEVIPEFFWDSRQVVASGNGDSLIVPADQDLDIYGNDINSQGSSGMNAIQTVIGVQMTGLRVAGAVASGVIHADFYGVNEETVNTLRNYHAFADLKWETTLLRCGQFWAPSFVEDCFPQTLSNNAGGPFEPYISAAQLWLQKEYAGLTFLVAAVSETNEYASAGGNNNTDQRLSSEFIRNSQLPALYGRVGSSGDWHEFFVGGETRTITPRLEGITGRKVFESITSISGFVLGKLMINDDAAIMVKFLYNENGVAEGLLGGYAITAIDPITDQRSYTNLRNFSCWMDAFWGKEIQPGIFVGIAKNLGSSDCLVDITTVSPATGITSFKDATIGFGTDIDWAFRVSSRLRLNWESFTLAGEVEYTAAAYGTVQRNGKVTNTHTVGNLRLLFGTAYSF